MTYFNDIQALISVLSTSLPSRSVLIAVEGRPCSGKTTLTMKLAEALDAETYHLDEFFLPIHCWPTSIQPGFPFPYFRYDEFILGVRTLAAGKPFTYHSYNWETDELSSTPTELIPGKKPIIIEGVSTLDSSLITYYWKSIFVVSDPQTEWNAILARDGIKFEKQWKNLYLPSVETYYKTRPWENAHIIFEGRGITSLEQAKSVLNNLK